MTAALNADPYELGPYLHAHIPISRQIGVRVLAAAEDEVRLLAPLEPNLNHRQTAFGGSLSALAILAGWSILWIRLRDRAPGQRIVIHSSEMSYIAPVEHDFVASCGGIEVAPWRRFQHTLASRGRARMRLRAEVTANGLVAATFEGRYVVIADPAAGPLAPGPMEDA